MGSLGILLSRGCISIETNDGAIWKEDLLFHVYELQTTFVSKPN